MSLRTVVTVPWAQRLGGAEAMLHTVLEGVERSEHQIELVFFADGPWPQEVREAGLRVDVVPVGRLREPQRWLAAVRTLAEIYRSRRPDVILNWSGKTQLYGSPAALLAGMADRVSWWQHAIPRRRSLDTAATLLPTRSIACYSQAARRAQARMLPRRPTVVIAPGTSPPTPAQGPPPLLLPRDIPVVGLVGRLQPWKGQDRLLRAQAILRDRGLPIHSVIVGGDSYGLSPDYAASLDELVRSLRLDDAVTMAGEVPDAGPYIEQMDVLVNASDPEPFGIVLLEGMARGVAVVAVDSGGPPDFVSDHETGILARGGDPTALADALEPLLASPALRRSLGEAGRRRFAREYTDAAVRDRFFGWLESLAAASAGDR